MQLTQTLFLAGSLIAAGTTTALQVTPDAAILAREYAAPETLASREFRSRSSRPYISDVEMIGRRSLPEMNAEVYVVRRAEQITNDGINTNTKASSSPKKLTTPSAGKGQKKTNTKTHGEQIVNDGIQTHSTTKDKTAAKTADKDKKTMTKVAGMQKKKGDKKDAKKDDHKKDDKKGGHKKDDKKDGKKDDKKDGHKKDDKKGSHKKEGKKDDKKEKQSKKIVAAKKPDTKKVSPKPIVSSNKAKTSPASTVITNGGIKTRDGMDVDQVEYMKRGSVGRVSSTDTDSDDSSSDSSESHPTTYYASGASSQLINKSGSMKAITLAIAASAAYLVL